MAKYGDGFQIWLAFCGFKFRAVERKASKNCLQFCEKSWFRFEAEFSLESIEVSCRSYWLPSWEGIEYRYDDESSRTSESSWVYQVFNRQLCYRPVSPRSVASGPKPYSEYRPRRITERMLLTLRRRIRVQAKHFSECKLLYFMGHSQFRAWWLEKGGWVLLASSIKMRLESRGNLWDHVRLFAECKTKKIITEHHKDWDWTLLPCS